MLSIMFNRVGPNHVSLYEVPKSAFVTKPGKKRRHYKFRPLTAANPTRLEFKAIQLAHAIVKADCYQRDRFEWFMAWCFLIQHHRVFDWNSTELRLNPGVRNLYFDFVQTTLIGRVGNGLTLLLANELGYPFHAHFVTYLAKNPPAGGVVPPNKAPDFICGTTTSRAIFESKGSFPGTGTLADVSAALNDGLTQIGNWPTILGISKSYACASYVRESGDTDPEGSLTIFVDPESDNDQPTIEFPPVRLLRENYAAWFVAMGLPDVAARLRSGDSGSGVSHRFVIYRYDPNIGERKSIAFPSDHVADHEVREALGRMFEMPRFGIELEVLLGIPDLAQGRIHEVFGETLLPESASQSDTSGGSYSLFPDGTFLGAIPRLSVANPDFIEIIL
jgi:hypothetical protein